MKSLNEYINEKLVINKDFVDSDSNDDRLYDTFEETLNKNYKKRNKYMPFTWKTSDVKSMVDKIFTNTEIHDEMMNGIDDIIDIMKTYGDNDSVKRYTLDEWLVNYKSSIPFYSIVKNKCDYIFGENNPENGLLYFISNYFDDCHVLGTMTKTNKESLWIRKK